MTTNIALYRSLAVTVLGLGAFLTACGDDTTGSGGAGGSGSSASSSKSSGSSSSASSSGSSSSSGGSAGPTLKTINKTPFDPTKGQLPEGLAVTADGTTAFLGYAPTGEIIKVTLPEGIVSAFGSVPKPPDPVAGAAQGLVLGLTVHPTTGDVYVGVGSFVAPATYQGGVYKIPKAGGDAGAVFSKDAALVFPNGLVFDATGNLYVADSATATIFKIGSDGKAVAWLTNDLLKGDKANTCAAGLPFAIGANGIALVGTDLIVANTDKASLIKIPIKGDGTADAPVEFVKPDATCTLKSIDGISADPAGNIYLAANAQNALYKVSTDGKTTTKLVDKGTFDGPASIVFAKVGGVDELVVTNSGIITAATGGTPKPSLVSYGPLK